jgi:D-alanine-D-alanine ligase-like ATP-grasp enzyme/acylphosphatase
MITLQNTTTYIEAATPENARLLNQIIALGENNFTASIFFSRSGNPINRMLKHAAEERSLETIVVNNRHIELYFRNQCIAIFSPNTPNLNFLTFKVNVNKIRTKMILSARHIPVPSGKAYTEKNKALLDFHQRRKPQVIKPLDGAHGNGVSVAINSEVDFERAWILAKQYSKTIIMEDFKIGDELRLIVLDGKIIAAVCRVPAYVVGDGHHSIAELMSIKNEQRQRNPLTRAYPLKTTDYLTQVHELDETYIPEKGKYIRLAGASNIAQGGEAISLIDQLHPSFHDFAQCIYQTIPGATQIGIDVIVKNFTANAFDDNAIVIEVNSDPAIATPAFATYGKAAVNIVDQLLDYALKQFYQQQQPALFSPQANLKAADVFSPVCGGQSYPKNNALQTNLLTQAAHKRNLKVKHLDADTTLISNNNKQLAFYLGMSQDTLLSARRATNNKDWTKNLLQKAGIPTPIGKIFQLNQLESGWLTAQQIGLPVVVKPFTGSGGSGVTTHIQSFEQFEAAWKYASATGSMQIIVESCHDGKDYRVVVIGHSVVAVAERTPAHVIGDGLSSIQQLISQRNEARSTNPYHASKPIKVTLTMQQNLAQLGLNCDSILPQGQQLLLHRVANIGSGGESSDKTLSMHPDWANIAVLARKSVFNLPHAGLDIIAENIQLSPHHQKWVIIEINANPDFGVNHFPMHGKGRDVAGALLDYLFNQPEYCARKVILTGKFTGLNFRQWIWKQAHKRNLRGWVKSVNAHQVEFLISGTSNAINDMCEHCAKGSSKSIVEDIKTTSYSGTIPDGFTVINP